MIYFSQTTFSLSRLGNIHNIEEYRLKKIPVRLEHELFWCCWASPSPPVFKVHKILMCFYPRPVPSLELRSMVGEDGQDPSGAIKQNIVCPGRRMLCKIGFHSVFACHSKNMLQPAWMREWGQKQGSRTGLRYIIVIIIGIGINIYSLTGFKEQVLYPCPKNSD